MTYSRMAVNKITNLLSAECKDFHTFETVPSQKYPFNAFNPDALAYFCHTSLKKLNEY